MLNTKNIKKVKYGNNERYNFSKVKEVEVPYLLEIQKESYRRFIDHDIDEVLKEFSPITDYAGKAEIYFLGHTIEDKPALLTTTSIFPYTSFILIRVLSCFSNSWYVLSMDFRYSRCYIIDRS